MSIIGTWKVKKIMSFGEEGPQHITVAEFDALPEKDEEMAQMVTSVLKITEDGVLQVLMPIPAEAIEAARADGAPVTEDGFVLMDSFEWTERDGAYFCSNESMGTDPMPLNFDAEGGLEFMGGMLIFESVQ